MSATPCFGYRTWIPRYMLQDRAIPPGGAAGSATFEDCIQLGVISAGALSDEETSPRYFAHFELLGLFNRQPLYRDLRTRETFLTPHRVDIAPVEQPVPKQRAVFPQL